MMLVFDLEAVFSKCMHTCDTSLIFKELPEMSHKISSKIYHFLRKFWNLPHLNDEWNQWKISLMSLWNLSEVYAVNMLFPLFFATENTNLPMQLLQIVQVFMHQSVLLCNNSDQTWFYPLTFAGPLLEELIPSPFRLRFSTPPLGPSKC